MDTKLAQLAAIALKEREVARRLAEDAISHQRRSEAALRVILGQLRLQRVEVDYPVSELQLFDLAS